MARSRRQRARRNKPAASKSERSATQKSGTQRTAAAPDWLIVAVSGLGMLITAYLTAAAWWGAAPALCGPGSGCDVIQQSHWSRFLGLPISLWGFGLYAVLGLSAWRMRPGLRRWRRLWNLALIGLGISVYLTGVGLVALDAVCGWCLASLATITTLFVLVTVRRPASAPGMSWGYWSLNSAALVGFVVVMMHLVYSDLLGGREDPRLQALATHLDESGARFYGAFWCSACQQQKRLFGASADRLPYVECTPDGRGGIVAQACVVENVTQYPTWVIDGRRYEGVLRPEEIARHAEFDWDAAAAD